MLLLACWKAAFPPLPILSWTIIFQLFIRPSSLHVYYSCIIVSIYMWNTCAVDAYILSILNVHVLNGYRQWCDEWKTHFEYLDIQQAFENKNNPQGSTDRWWEHSNDVLKRNSLIHNSGWRLSILLIRFSFCSMTRKSQSVAIGVNQGERKANGISSQSQLNSRFSCFPLLFGLLLFFCLYLATPFGNSFRLLKPRYLFDFVDTV